ncbi:MAG: hydroxysqualene dehydroxylase HpnE [Planctomycetota bacterium]
MTSPQVQKIVIVGGGIAGLAAAETLTRFPDASRYRVTIYESRRRCGGRAGSFVTRSHDGATTTTDYCQHVTMGCCTNLLGLLRRTGLIDHWERYQSLTFYHPDHGLMPFERSRLPAPFHLTKALLGLRFLSWNQQRQVATAMWRLFRTKPEALISQTAETWLVSANQSEATRRTFWDVILISALGDTCENVSMAAARKVMIDGFAATPDASDVYVPRLTLSKVFGEVLPAVLHDRGVEVVTGQSIKSIEFDGDAPKEPSRPAVRLGNGDRHVADQLIVATPWHRAVPWLDKAGIQRINEQHQVVNGDASQQLASSPITGIHLWLDRWLTDLPHVVMVGTVSQWLFRDPIKRRSISDMPDECGCYHQVVISGHHEVAAGDKKACVATVMRELNAAFPSTRDAVCLQSRVVTDPNSVFSVSPESFDHRPVSTTSNRRVHLAGDWIQTGWPATMESAVISGVQAACGAANSSTLNRDEYLERPLQQNWLSRMLIRDDASH